MGSLILLTGATGFLGAQIARLVLRDTDHRLAILVGGQDAQNARRRLERVWSIILPPTPVSIPSEAASPNTVAAT
jgi:thioester reductase-like protein